ncbi:MAG: sulfite exporter TauE/SafE family protein [Cellvibrionales bacterium]|nr:sulfite exporter TauE/SafE family protein [Cellvibrionales bacterium]
MSLTLAITAFSMGLLSSVHCVFMCGGIASALSSQIHHGVLVKTILFHAGRMLCYGALGLLFGGLIHLFANEYHAVAKILRHLAGILLIGIGMYFIGLDKIIKSVEQRFVFIWRRLQPWMQSLLPIQKNTHALVVGFCWGFLPCGIIYSTLLWVSATSQGFEASLLMMVFGLGTLPAFALIHLSGLPLIQYFKQKSLRQAVGGLFVFFGVWTIVSISPSLMPIQPPFCLDP